MPSRGRPTNGIPTENMDSKISPTFKYGEKQYNLSVRACPVLFKLLCDEDFREELLRRVTRNGKTTDDLVTILCNQVRNQALIDKSENKPLYNQYGDVISWPKSFEYGQVMAKPLNTNGIEASSNSQNGSYKPDTKLVVFLNELPRLLKSDFSDQWYTLSQTLLNINGFPKDGIESIVDNISEKRWPHILLCRFQNSGWVYNRNDEILSVIKTASDHAVRHWYETNKKLGDDEILRQVKELMGKHPLFQLMTADEEAGLKNKSLICSLLDSTLHVNKAAENRELILGHPLSEYFKKFENELHTVLQGVPISLTSLTLILGVIARTADPQNEFIIDVERAKALVDEKAKVSSSESTNMWNDASKHYESVVETLGIGLAGNSSRSRVSLSFLFEVHGNISQFRICDRVMRMLILAVSDVAAVTYEKIDIDCIYEKYKEGINSLSDTVNENTKDEPYNQLDIEKSFLKMVYTYYFLDTLPRGYVRKTVLLKKVLPSLRDTSVLNRPLAEIEALACAYLIIAPDSLDLPKEQFVDFLKILFGFYTFPSIRDVLRTLVLNKPEYAKMFAEQILHSCLQKNKETVITDEEPIFVFYSGLKEVRDELKAILDGSEKSTDGNNDWSNMDEEWKKAVLLLADADQHRAKTFDGSIHIDLVNEIAFIGYIANEYLKNTECPPLAFAVSMCGYEILNLVRREKDAVADALNNVLNSKNKPYAPVILRALILADELIRRCNATYSKEIEESKMTDNKSMLVGTRISEVPFLLCGSYRAISAIDWTNWCPDGGIRLDVNQQSRYLLNLLRETPRFRMLMTRLLSYTNLKDDAIRIARSRISNSERIYFLKYDRITDLPVFLADPRKLQGSDAG